MFVINEDNSIYVTRGDILLFSVKASNDGNPYTFKVGDVVRVCVVEKKAYENVVLQKDFPITTETDTVEIFLEEEDTKIGETISKPKDYWYEIVLNPETEPQTIVGYDEDGAKVFKLFPEGEDLPEMPITEEDIPIIDAELNLLSSRPVENRAVAKEIVRIDNTIKDVNAQVTEQGRAIAVERERITNLAKLTSGSTTGDAELIDARVGADGTTYANLGESIRTQISNINGIADSFKNIAYCSDIREKIGVAQDVASTVETYHCSFNGYTFEKNKQYLVLYDVIFTGGINKTLNDAIRPTLIGYDGGFQRASFVGQQAENKFIYTKDIVLGNTIRTYSVVRCDHTFNNYKIGLASCLNKSNMIQGTTQVTFKNVVVIEVDGKESGLALAEKLSSVTDFRSTYSFAKVTQSDLADLGESITAKITSQLDTTEDICVLPNTIYTTEKELLARLNGVTDKKLDICVSYSTGATEYGIRSYNFNELDCSKLPSGTVRAYIRNGDVVKYAKDITVKKATKVSNKPIKIMCIGDSITNRNLGNMIKNYLKTVYGMTDITNVGTMTNQFEQKGEGREGWKFTNFIGKSWSSVSGTAITPLTSKAQGSVSTNPFVRVATSTDDATKVYDYKGTGYIFDFKNYLTVQEIETPDVITIALSTNDISYNDNYLSECENGLKIMVNSIREALPNVKIGVIPTFNFAMTETGNEAFKKALKWTKRCIEIVETLNDSKTNIVPSYMFVDRMSAYPISLADIVSDTTNIKEATVTDSVHTQCINVHADVIARWICNVI
jgi:hypothetical protein